MRDLKVMINIALNQFLDICYFTVNNEVTKAVMYFAVLAVISTKNNIIPAIMILFWIGYFFRKVDLFKREYDEN